MAWLPPDLPRIPLLEVQGKGSTTEKEKKKKSTSKVSEAPKRKHPEEGSKQEMGEKESKRHKPEGISGEESHKKDEGDPNPPQTNTTSITTPLSVSPINVVPPISSSPLITQIPLFQWSHDFAGIDSTFDTVPPPSLQKEIGEFRVPPQAKQATLATEILVNICPQEQVDDLQTKAKQKDQELAKHVTEIQQLKTIPSQLVANVQKQLTLARDEVGNLKRALLEEYYELPGVTNQEHRVRKEATVLRLREEVDSMRSKFLLERETCLGESEENMHWIERARARVGRADAILEDTLLLTDSSQSDVQELVPPICSLKLLVPEPPAETKMQGTNDEAKTLAPPTETENVLEPTTKQTRMRPLGSLGQGLEEGKTSKVPPSPNFPSMKASHDIPSPTHDLDELVHNISSAISPEAPPVRMSSSCCRSQEMVVGSYLREMLDISKNIKELSFSFGHCSNSLPNFPPQFMLITGLKGLALLTYQLQ
eukprot:Gb_24304 [translate_table: standard]